MPREKKGSGGTEGAPLWVVTFADLMSLLLTFFVLLLSFSTISEEKFNDAIASLQGALGLLPSHTSMIAPHVRVRREQQQREQQQQQELIERLSAARQLQRQLQVEGQEKKVKVQFDALGGLKISLPNAALFDVGNANLRVDGFQLMRELGALIREIPEAFVEVRGHTDNLPITPGGQFRDNRDLSYFRAYSVVDYLVNVSGIPATQFEVQALGEFQPLAGNDTEAGRAANRRVEVFVRGPVDQSRMDPFIKRIETEFGVEARDSVPLTPGALDGLR